MTRYMRRRAGPVTTKSKSILMIWQIRSDAADTLASITAVGLGCLLALAGCSSGGSSLSTASLVNTVRGAFHGLGTSAITRDDVTRIPFASLGYRIGDNAEEMLVLAGREGDNLVWTSSAKITVVTHHGRIVRTIGLQHDLRNLTLREGTATSLEPGAASGWNISLDDPDEHSAMLSCRVISAEPEVITTLQRNVSVTRINEACYS